MTASTTHQLRFQVGGWLRCMELRRCLDTGPTPPFLHHDHSPLFIHYSMLVTAILGLLAPLAAYTSYYFIFAILVAQVSLQISSSQFLVDIKSRVCARGSPIHPLIRIYQDGFPARNEAGSVAHSYDDCMGGSLICLQQIFVHTKFTKIIRGLDMNLFPTNLSRFTSFVFLGGTAGTVLTLPLCGILLNNYPWEVSPITFIIILVLMVEINSQFVFCQHDLLGPTGLLINHIICLGRLLCNFFGLPRVVRLF